MYPLTGRNCNELCRLIWARARRISHNTRCPHLDFAAYADNRRSACVGRYRSAVALVRRDDAADGVPELDAASGGEIGRALNSSEADSTCSSRRSSAAIGARGWHSSARAARRIHERARPEAGVGCGLAARRSARRRVAFVLRAATAPATDVLRARAGGRRRVDAGGVLRRQLQDRRAGARSRPAWTIRPGDGAAPRVADARPPWTRTHARRVQQPRARARQRAGQHADAARVCRRAAALASEGGRQRRDPRRASDRRARHGPAARRRARQQRAAAPDGVPPRSARRAGTPVLGLVGKGITFDTGGISIKPADGMERMKDDMAGGAAVACAMRAIALLKAPMRVIGIVPTTENMPGGRAIKPGDVLKSAQRQDGRSHQHRRRRAADPRRRPLVRAPAGRDASRGRRHADRRLRRGARARSRAGCSGRPDRLGRAGAARRRSRRRSRRGRCRCSTSIASS